VDKGLDAEAPLRIFVMGGGSGRRSGAGRLVHGGRWWDEHEWPLARTRFTDYYLHGDGLLTTDPPREERSATTYRFDPARPVPSIGGDVSSLRDVLPLPPGLADPSDERPGSTSNPAARGWGSQCQIAITTLCSERCTKPTPFTTPTPVSPVRLPWSELVADFFARVRT